MFPSRYSCARSLSCSQSVSFREKVHKLSICVFYHLGCSLLYFEENGLLSAIKGIWQHSALTVERSQGIRKHSMLPWMPFELCKEKKRSFAYCNVELRTRTRGIKHACQQPVHDAYCMRNVIEMMI
ncbi:hypothetical protein KP509_1Z016100 [Ceratopteris richardii]|nr:hypothetical protein KP509_1Z016100 [Ceratopteris richardii]